MSLCTELGEWIKENVVEPIEQFFEYIEEVCEEVRKWVEKEVRTPIERWREELEERCEERPCNWKCLCCNKWFCWLATIFVKFIEWLVEVVGEWLLETLCKFITRLIKFVVMAIVEVTRWVVLLVVCLVEALCALFILSAALALLAMLMAIVTAANLSLIPVAVGFALAALAMARLLCGEEWCRIVGAIGWALKWAIVLGGAYAVGTLNGMSALIVTIYGGVLAALMIWLEKGTCKVPSLWARP